MSRRNNNHQPPEVAALLNPAFIALVAERAASAYFHESGNGLPVIYVPIISTISIYPEARQSLSMRVSTQFTSWIERSGDLQTGLHERIVAMTPIVNEGILFGLAYDVIRISEGLIVSGSRAPTAAIKGSSADVEMAQKAAVYLGRWFVHAGKPSTVCAILGVKP